ncbi:hypothetical protein V5799_034030 [Amblyomma americanum]|uniref:Uncharacterized protein n=1 Tax=Amblyomma americanum TaxID=6943 RepID=A0AAQ4DLM1_AMBAM
MEPIDLPVSRHRFYTEQETDSWPQGERPKIEYSERRQQARDQALRGDAERESLPLEDASHAGRYLRYASFVVSLAAATSATLVVTPVVLLGRLKTCRDGCLTLDEDLRRSLDTSVHPCDDFYGHVCKGWDSSDNLYLDPLEKYRAAFSRRLVREILLQKIPDHSIRSRGKAAGFLFRCLSKYGMPMFWGFYVGRHPFLPAENTIYMTLDPRCIQWIRDIEALSVRGNADDYLRRSAEIVGGTGQSYSTMIRHVLNTHNEVVEIVRRFWGEDTVPQLHNLSEPELRRAVNGHLPDDSQLWPVDEMVNLHPELYAQVDSELLNRSSESQERFKLFLGAYVVWALTPMVSSYLTNSMLVDMGRERSLHDYNFFKCMEALEMLMPMVKWQMHRDLQKNLEPTWNIVHLSKLSIEAFARSYSESLAQQVRSILGLVGVNAFNMTSSWNMLDDAFAYLPNDTAAPFFKLYRRAAQATVTFFKQSLHRPGHSIYHVPGIASVRTYRLVIAREVSLYHFLTSAPLYEPWHPLAVISALAGTSAVAQINVLLRLTLFYDYQFKAYPPQTIDPGVMRLYEDTLRLNAALNASGLLPDASRQESHEVYLASYAALSASNVPDLQTNTAVGGDTGLSRERQQLFWGFPLEQLFFYLQCFSHCGAAGRELQKKVCAQNFTVVGCTKGP